MILVVTLVEKFTEGGWLTIGHHDRARHPVRADPQALSPRSARRSPQLSKQLAIDSAAARGSRGAGRLDPTKPTAVVLAGGFGGLGLHTLMQIPRVFPEQFHQVVFVSAGVIDAGVFKGKDEIDAMRTKSTATSRSTSSSRATHMGWAADRDSAIGTEAVMSFDHLCREVALRFPRSVFFAGKLIFAQDSWYQRILHNETAAAVERRLQFAGLPMIVMPIRMFGS